MSIKKEEAKIVYSIMNKLKESTDVDFKFVYEQRLSSNEMYISISLNNSYYVYITKKDINMYNIFYTNDSIGSYSLDFNLVDIKYVLSSFIKNIHVLEQIEKYEGVKADCINNLNMLKRPEYIRDLRLNEILC